MKRDDYISWEDYFMGVAELSARRSKDPKTQVGCSIIDPESKHILSIGYNGLPRGFNDDDFHWSDSDDYMDSKHPYIVHAEANAILNATAKLEGSEAYVTMFPCHDCAKLLVQSGVKKITYKDGKYLTKESGKVAREIFEKSGVEVVQYKEEENEDK